MEYNPIMKRLKVYFAVLYNKKKKQNGESNK
jgi:hypothetical protein